MAAYTDALAGHITRDDRYAKKSIALMDAGSAVIKEHTNSNAPGRPAGPAPPGPRPPSSSSTPTPVPGPTPAASRPCCAPSTSPRATNGSNSNGNWELSMMEAAVGISVFLEDRTSYDKAIASSGPVRPRTSTSPPTARCPRPCRARTSTPPRRSSMTGRAVQLRHGFYSGDPPRDFNAHRVRHRPSRTSPSQPDPGEDLYGTDVGAAAAGALIPVEVPAG